LRGEFELHALHLGEAADAFDFFKFHLGLRLRLIFRRFIAAGEPGVELLLSHLEVLGRRFHASNECREDNAAGDCRDAEPPRLPQDDRSLIRHAYSSPRSTSSIIWLPSITC
jgi:hypothetical protein